MKFLIVATLLISATQAFAFSYNCRESRPQGYAPSICRGRSIPVDRTRNFSDHRLECTSNSDNFVRRPQKFDFNDWSTKTTSGNPDLAKEANLTRRDPKVVPDISWRGTIPYETVEKWNWQACELHQSAAECGTHQECHDQSEQECDHDSKGNSTNCHMVTKNVCEDVANTCYYDVTYSESLHCSNEVMNYTAHFARPQWSEWNPQKDGKVAEVFPNKYDLLPGEVENVQTSNSVGSSTVLRPTFEVVNGWNKYGAPEPQGSAVGAQCLQDKTYDFHYEVQTIGRKIGKKRPNAFRLPVDMEGHSVDVFGGAWALDAKTGKKLRPSKLFLADSSAAMAQSISEISRKSKDRELRKLSSGQGQNRDGSQLGDDKDPLSKSFMKNTIVRIQMFKINRWWFDKTVSREIKTSDMKSVQASANVLSKDQEIANSDSFEFNLDSPNDVKENIYAHAMDGLMPDRVYELRVSMYQKGIPFYDQACEDDHSGWKCFGYWNGYGLGTPFNTEGRYFSDPIKIRFETPNVETRTLGEEFRTFARPASLSFVGWLAEKIGHERTSGANR